MKTGKMWDFNDAVHSDITLKSVYRKLESASVLQVSSSIQSANVNTYVNMNTERWIFIGGLALFKMGLVIYLKKYVDGTHSHIERRNEI